MENNMPEELEIARANLTREILSIPNKRRGRYKLDFQIRFRKIAKEKVNLENPDRIFLGYKVEDYIHLYIDDPTPGGRKTLGCWGPNHWGIVEYGPPKTEFNGMIYEQHNPLRFDNIILDDLIATVIRNRIGEKVVK